MWRFSGFGEIKRLTLACALAGAASAAVVMGLGLVKIPRAVLALHPVVTLMGLSLVRIAYRMLYEHARARIAGSERRDPPRAGDGRGQAARLLIAGLHRQGWTVLGLFDDDPAKQRARIGGVPVLGPLEALRGRPCAAPPRMSSSRCPRPAPRSAGARWTSPQPPACRCSRCPAPPNCAKARPRGTPARHRTRRPARPRAGGAGRSRHRADAAGQDGAHHRRRRQHRQRAVPPGGALPAGAAGAGRAERVQPLHHRAGTDRALSRRSNSCA